jgi:hypothetical protein
MEFEIKANSELSEYEIENIVDWQLWEGLKGKSCTICNKPFTPKDKSVIYSGKDKDGNLLGAHKYCWNRNN